MSKGNTTEQDWLDYAYRGVAMPNYGNNLYIALHTADPGEAGTQSTNACSYTSYDRAVVVRDNTNAGFTRSGSVITNAAQITFPKCTGGGSQTATHWSSGTSEGQIINKGALTESLVINNNITPIIPIGGLSITED